MIATSALALALLVGIAIGYRVGARQATHTPLAQLSPTNPGTYAAALGMIARAHHPLQRRARWN